MVWEVGVAFSLKYLGTEAIKNMDLQVIQHKSLPHYLLVSADRKEIKPRLYKLELRSFKTGKRTQPSLDSTPFMCLNLIRT